MVNDMIYVFDTSSFVHAFRYYKEDIFPSFWKSFHAIVKAKRLTSVMQVYQEVASYGNNLSKWANENKKFLFTEPDENEQQIVQKILSDAHNRKLVPVSAHMKNVPTADPFVIAKAKNISGCAVAEDGFNSKGELKKNVVKLASVCKKLDVPCLHFNNFMRQERWKF